MNSESTREARDRVGFTGRALLRACSLVLACASVSGCSLIAPPYGIPEPLSPSGAYAVVNSRAIRGKEVPAPGTLLWKLEAGSPAYMHQSGQLGRLMAWGGAPRADLAPAFLSYGPYWQLPLKASLRVRFRLDAGKHEPGGTNDRIAVLDVHEPSVGILTAMPVMRDDFPAEGGPREFTLDFQNDPSKLRRLEFRIAWWGTQELKHESTEILAGR